ncbi:MAG: hypothetical protein ACXVCX_16440 [Ktedonobacterales bacterium]
MSNQQQQQQQAQLPRRPQRTPNWSAAWAAFDAQGAAHDQAVRDRMAQRNAMIARTSKLAAMSEEEREAFWQQEAQDAARSGVAQQAQQAARDRVQRWQQWLADHPVMYDIHGTRRYYDANEPPRWFV